jgi:raffinose/stachyose/melibiose transport system substrate-binding protein
MLIQGGKAVNMTRPIGIWKAALLASACLSFGAGPAFAQVHLDFWSEFSSGQSLKAMNEIVDDFNKANPDIQVTHTGFENTPYETALKTSFSGGKPADLVEVNAGGDMFQYAEAGQLVDLSDFVTSQSAAVVRPGLDTFYKLEGKAWGVPLQLNIGNLFYYNKDMFAAQSIDPAQLNTWDGLLKAAQTFKDAGITPIAFGDQEGWPGNHIHNHLLLRLLGVSDYVNIWLRTLDPSVKASVTFASDAETKSWSMLKDLLDKGYFTAGYLADDFPTANKLFLTGKAPLFTTGSWFLSDLQNSAPDLKWGVVPFPAVDGAPGKQTDLVTAGLVVSMTKASAHPEEAKKFLAYLMSEPVQKKWAEETVSLTPYQYDTSGWTYSDQFKMIAGLLANSTAAVPFGDMLEDQSCNVPWTWQASQGILSGDTTPEEVGKGHEDCVQKLIATKFK